MKISLHWIKEYVKLPDSFPELENVLTRAGLTVEGIEHRGGDFEKVVVGQILESTPHPDADRLSVCQVDDGSGDPRQIVCGAKNYRVGDRVPVALPGAVLPGNFKIKVGKLRGIESAGMMCSAKELRLAEDAEGLLILPPDSPPGSPIGAVFPADTILDLEVTPNRPDCLGHLGVAREIAAFTGQPLPSIKPEQAPLSKGIDIEASRDCPFYTARLIRGVRVAPSPAWLQQRLQALGLRPINNIVDITNYVMMEIGQPLHAFDAARASLPLCVRSAHAGESLLALDGREYALPEGALVIAGANGPLAIAGIMGGETSGVTESTTDIVLESALFELSQIRRTARNLGLHSDSSYRFERGVDPHGVLSAGLRAAQLIAELADGHPDETILSGGKLPAERPLVSLRPDRCRQVLGTEISGEEIKTALAALGLASGENQKWKVPSWRLDLTREIDLIEEVARLHGIEKISGRLLFSPAPLSAADLAHDTFKALREVFVGFGYFEARTSTLISSAKSGSEAIALRNPLGEEQATLRPGLLPSLVEAAGKNFRHGATGIRLFEIGKTYHRDEPEERWTLGLVLCGTRSAPHWQSPDDRLVDFFDLKGHLEAILPAGCEFRPADPSPPLAIRADITLEGNRLGLIGLVHPSVARDLNAPGPLLVAELALDPLLPTTPGARVVSPLPEFPSSSRDIAVLAPQELPYSQIAAVILEAREPLLEKFVPFDLYHDKSGKSLGPSRKSLAISLTFRSPERTLTTAEVNDASERIKSRLKSSLGVDFRE